jgi:hypothetical protein
VLNAEYSYQLTAVGSPAPTLHVERQIEGGRFRIAGGSPGQLVCWIVTGSRVDPWAKANPIRVERPKRRKDRGKYLNPELFGKPKSVALDRLEGKPPRRRRRQS